jgi:hypothetical protein
MPFLVITADIHPELQPCLCKSPYRPTADGENWENSWAETAGTITKIASNRNKAMFFIFSLLIQLENR